MTTLKVLSLLLLTTPVASKCITQDELRVNMPRWVSEVPYSHRVNKTWGDIYPTDCSGFVSWALQTSRNIKSYEYGSSVYSTRITTDELQYGDIITHVTCDTDQVSINNIETDHEILTDSAVFFPPNYISGHIFFFDRWDDEGHDNFWAYESTSTKDQTDACLAQTNPVTRSECLNHYVLKSRSVPDKWAKNNCSSTTYGYVTGGPQRLSPDLLCPQ